MGFDHRTSTGLGETETPGLEGTHTKKYIVCPKTQRKGTVTAQETDPKVPTNVGGSPVEAWVDKGSPQEKGNRQQQSGKVPLGLGPLGGYH